MTEDSAISQHADRPNMPVGYGLNQSSAGLLPWAWAEERLTAARNYWICTTRPDGRPHASPVWGVWLDGALYFGTDSQSRKARNLAANPAVTVHLESGDEVVIIDGWAELVTLDPALSVPLDNAYQAKYQMNFSEAAAAAAVLRVQPQVVLAWLESDFPNTATRWRFAG